jgi:hypothetical protein
MVRVVFCLILVLCAGCAAVGGGYLRPSEHPFTRKLYGDYDKIVEAVKGALAQDGWKIKTITNAGIYERSTDEGESAANDLLIFTQPKKHFKVLYSSYTYINVLVHQTGEGAAVEIRDNRHSKKLANALLDRMEQNLLESK